MKIIVDADGCPKNALQICFSAAQEFSAAVWTVASFNHNIDSDNHVMVDSSPQAADLKILNMAEEGDLIITGDIGLAAMVLNKNTRCLNPSGREFEPEKIDTLLQIRQIKAKHRRSGGRTKGPAKRTSEHDRQFEKTLRQILTQMTRNTKNSGEE